MHSRGDIKRMTLEDLPAIITLTVTVRNDAYMAFVPPRHMNDFLHHNSPKKIGDKLTLYAQRGGSVGYIYFHNGEIVAYILGNDIDLTISYLFVSKNMQGSGIGSKLFDVFLERNHSLYTLKVVEANIKAIAMYERHGFRMTHRLEKPYFGLTKIAMERQVFTQQKE